MARATMAASGGVTHLRDTGLTSGPRLLLRESPRLLAAIRPCAHDWR